MTITPPNPVSLLDSSRTAERTRAEWEVAVLAKNLATQREQGSAIVALIEATVTIPQPAQPVPAEFDRLA
jgi:hypothetical protein